MRGDDSCSKRRMALLDAAAGAAAAAADDGRSWRLAWAFGKAEGTTAGAAEAAEAIVAHACGIVGTGVFAAEDVVAVAGGAEAGGAAAAAAAAAP